MINDSITINGKIGSGLRFISGTEPFAMGHYPGNALFPGVLSIELIIEVCEQLVRQLNGQIKSWATHIESIRFLEAVRPGDVLHIEVEINESRKNGYMLNGTIINNRDLVVVKGLFGMSPEEVKTL